MKIVIDSTEIDGLKILQNTTTRDSRGLFTKLYSEDFFTVNEIDFKIAQINLSVTERVGTIRGMHFQMAPFSEKKIIRCMRGRVFDVIIDLRRNSSSFLQFETFELSESNGFALHVPKGCAHGFQVVDGPAEMMYLHSEEYRPEFEAGINPFDAALMIDWPVDVTLISDRDKSFPSLDGSFEGLTI